MNEPRLKVIPGAEEAEPGKLAAQAFAKVHQLIVNLELAPGSVVTERELAGRIEVGKGPVREALQQLAMTGLIRPRSGAGYEVAPITLRDARDLFETWRVLEPAAVELAVDKGINEEHIALIERLDKGEEIPGVDELRRELLVHAVMVSAAQVHRLLWAFSLQVQPHAERLMRFAARLGATFDIDHHRLVEALRSGEPAVARAAAADHVGEVERRVMDAFLLSTAAQDVNLAADPEGADTE